MATVMDLKTAEQSYVFFWGRDTPFSQFYACEFEVDGQKYNCAEQYMMHQKAVLFKDDEIAQEIMENTSPPKIKGLGRKVKNFDDDIWDEKCVDVVKKGNLHKFSQNPDLKSELFATKGKTLVEASPRDNKWGIGLSSSNPKAWNKDTWRGKNLLGYALTDVRNELMKQEGLL